MVDWLELVAKPIALQTDECYENAINFHFRPIHWQFSLEKILNYAKKALKEKMYCRFSIMYAIQWLKQAISIVWSESVSKRTKRKAFLEIFKVFRIRNEWSRTMTLIFSRILHCVHLRKWSNWEWVDCNFWKFMLDRTFWSNYKQKITFITKIFRSQRDCCVVWRRFFFFNNALNQLKSFIIILTVSNKMCERKWAKFGLINMNRFGDVLQMVSHLRIDVFNLFVSVLLNMKFSLI